MLPRLFSSPLFLPASALLLLAGIFRSFTLFSRKRSTECVCADNHSLQAIFISSPLATIAYDNSGMVRMWNPAAEALYGWKAEDVIGTPIPILSPEGEDEFWALREITQKGKTVDGLELLRRRKDGAVINVSLSAAPLYGADGDISGVVALYADITGRKRSESGLAKLRDVFEYTQMGVAVGNPDGKTLDIVNPAFAKMLGYTVNELNGTGIPEIFAPECRADLSECLRKVHETVHFIYESKLIRKDGTLFPVMIDSSAVKDDEGKVLYRISNFQDITERKNAEDGIRKLNNDLETRIMERTVQLETANMELESFNYSVSHDLRAPLRHINGFSSALLEDYGDVLDREGRVYLDRLCMASQKMGQLIDDLLELSRVARGELRRMQVDLSAICRAIASELNETECGRDVGFLIADGVKGLGDPSLLQVVLQNLVGNAWKYTSKREGAVIEFGVYDIDGRQTCFVRDNGVGFDMEYANKLFGPFQRLHRTEEFEGNGIGLATVQRIIHRHGGRVWGEGKVGEGAAFFFMLG